MRHVIGVVLLAILAQINAAPAPQLLGGLLLGGQRPLLGGAPNRPRPILDALTKSQPGPRIGAPQGNQGTGIGAGKATGGTFADARGQSATIPIGPFGGRVTLAESSALGVGIPGLGGKPGGGATAGGVGGGTIGPDGTNVAALSNADAQEGIAFGQAVGVGIDLPLLGVHQTFGHGGGIAVGK